MGRRNDQTSSSEKNRIRAEIDRQILAYLQQGGRIDVVAAHDRGPRKAIGSVWHGPDDIPAIEAENPSCPT